MDNIDLRAVYTYEDQMEDYLNLEFLYTMFWCRILMNSYEITPSFYLFCRLF